MIRALVRTLFSRCSTEDDYITIVYPAGEGAVVVHDSLSPTGIFESPTSLVFSNITETPFHEVGRTGFSDSTHQSPCMSYEFSEPLSWPTGIEPFDCSMGCDSSFMDINPATGLGMIEGTMMDVGGHHFGFD